jgi:hypothetical protein
MQYGGDLFCVTRKTPQVWGLPIDGVDAESARIDSHRVGPERGLEPVGQNFSGRGHGKGLPSAVA